MAQHWGAYRSTSLARFRHGQVSYRECPRCGFHNEPEVRHDSCDRYLFEVVLEPHDAPLGFDVNAPLTAEQHARAVPICEEALYVRDAAAPGGWRPWQTRDLDTYRDAASLGPQMRQCWVSPALARAVTPRLPPPAWPAAGIGGVAADVARGGPGNGCLPAKLRFWRKCGRWRGPSRHDLGYMGCPPCWEAPAPPVPYDHSGTAAPCLRDAPWRQKAVDTFLLMLCEDGSHGLDRARARAQLPMAVWSACAARLRTAMPPWSPFILPGCPAWLRARRLLAAPDGS